MSEYAVNNAQLGLLFDEHEESQETTRAEASGPLHDLAASRDVDATPRCFLLTHHRHVLEGLERGAFWPGRNAAAPDGTFGLPGGLLPLFVAPLPAAWVEHLCRGQAALRPVAVEIDWRRLPDEPVHGVADGRWTTVSLEPSELAAASVLAWPREILLSAVRAAYFRDDTERRDVGAMMQDFASMAHDSLPLATEPGLFGDTRGTEHERSEPDELASLMAVMHAVSEQASDTHGLDAKAQSRIDALQGALSMLVWATPKMDAWLDLLQALLTRQDTRSAELARTLGVPWLAALPALLPDTPPPATRPSGDLSGCLFRAAAEVFTACAPRAGLDVEQLFARLLETARTAAGDITSPGDIEPQDAMTAFEHAGLTVLGMKERFQARSFPDPVQQAIILTLLRPEPEKYRLWYSNEPMIAPGAWVTGAVLVGLLMGHTRLPADLRGNAHQQNALSAYVANLVAQGRGLAHWPDDPSSSFGWRLQGSGRDTQVVLESATGVWMQRPSSSRAHWLRADLDDPAIREAAIEIARHFSWSHCIRTVARVPDAEPRVRLKGPSEPTIEVAGKDHVLGSQTGFTIELPANTELHHELDRGSFRHALTCAGFDIRELERFSPHLFRADSKAVRSTDVCREPDVQSIPGLEYRPEYISPEEEDRLVEQIYRSSWSNELRRRVQHYGWRYDYRARQIDEGLRLGPLPPWIDELAERLFRSGLVRQKPDQVIVNEYKPGQGIASHIDCEPCFAEDIAIISLRWTYEMEFTRPRRKERVTRLLERRSLLVLRGEARYQWMHGIRARKSDRRISRQTRVSLTFRKVIAA